MLLLFKSLTSLLIDFFLSLTSPNVTSDNLVEEIKDYNESFKRMTKLKPFMEAVIGYIRKLEIIYDGSKKITKEMKDLKLYDLFAGTDTAEPKIGKKAGDI